MNEIKLTEWNERNESTSNIEWPWKWMADPLDNWVASIMNSIMNQNELNKFEGHDRSVREGERETREYRGRKEN